jgi:phenylalanyl-tRNA synthetase beta chain
MNISYKWLKEYVDFDLTPQQVCDALTSTGLKSMLLKKYKVSKGDLKVFMSAKC